MDKVGVFNDEDTWKLKDELRAKARAKLRKSEPEFLETAEMKKPPVLELDDKSGEAGQAEMKPPEELAARIEKEPEMPSTEEDAELKRLKQEIERTRTAYAKKDYEISNIFHKLRYILRDHLKTNPKDIHDSDNLYADYTIALNRFLDHKIEALKRQNLQPDELKKEMGDLMKYFTLEEKFNLFDARTMAKVGLIDGKIGEEAAKKRVWVLEKFKFVLSWQRNHRKLWMAGNVAATLAGFGIPRRIIAGFFAGVGIAGGIKNVQRSREIKAFKKEKKNRLSELENIERNYGTEEKLNSLNSWLSADNNNLNKKLSQEKWKEYARYTIGAVAGVAIGGGYASQAVKELWNYSGGGGIAGKVANYFGIEYSNTPKINSNGAHEPITEKPEPMIPLDENDARMPVETPDKIPEPEYNLSRSMHPLGESGNSIQPEASGKTLNVPAAEVLVPSENIELTIQKGSSFQGKIIEYLKQQGIKPKEAGKMAHRMWYNFTEKYPDTSTKDYFSVHPGAKIEIGIGTDGKYKVLSFQDNVPGSSRIGDLSGAVDKVAEELKAHEAVEKLQEQIQTENPETDVSDKINPEESPKGAEDLTEKMEEEMGVGNDKSAKIGGAVVAGSAIGAASVEKNKSGRKILKKSVDLAERKEFKELSKKYEFEFGESFISRAKKMILTISGNKLSRWAIIKNMAFPKLNEKNSLELKKVKKSIEAMEKNIMALYGDQLLKHKESETLKAWVARVVKISNDFEKEKENIKLAA